jgi:phage protein
LENRKDKNMDTLQQVKLDKIENLLQLLVNLLNKKGDMNQLEIMTQKEVLKELSISPNTLKSWERKGLPRLEPPIEGTRTVYYKRNDILKFLTN